MAKPKIIQSEKEKVDSVLSFLLIRSLLRPVSSTTAFSNKLVNRDGIIIKEPITSKEKDSLTSFDRIIFKLRRMLGSKISQLYSYNYIRNTDDKSTSLLTVKGSPERRAAIMKLRLDLEKLTEQYSFTDFDSALTELILEDLEEYRNAELNS